MKDPVSQLRSATRRAKSDVANKLVSMFLHELSRQVSQGWLLKVDDEAYERLVREKFGNRCPYCCCDLVSTTCVIEHLDGMNRHRAGLHVAGNVLVACRRCNNEKRRDDSLGVLSLAPTGWESFLSHDSTRCLPSCQTCRYWTGIWPEQGERGANLLENRGKIRAFRASFVEYQQMLPFVSETLPKLLGKLYVDCQAFAEREIKLLIEGLGPIPPA
jgi:hypothetical protein